MKRLLLFLLLSAGILPLHAKYYRVTAFSPTDGLSHADVRCIYQDRYGYIWFCTADGLNRYDGINNTVFRKDLADPHSIGTSNFRCITQDQQGNYWIGSDGDGLFRYETSCNRFSNYKIGTGIQSVYGILPEEGQRLWVLSNGIVYLVEVPSIAQEPLSILCTLDKDSDGNPLYITAIHQFEDDIIFSSNSGLKRLRKINGDYEIYDDASFIGMKINDLKFDASGTLWIASAGKLFRKEKYKGVETVISYDDQIISFEIEPKGGFWLYLKKRGLIYKNEEEPEEYITTNKNAFFVRNIITSMMVDDSSNLWLCSNNRGVVRINLLGNPIHSIKSFGDFLLKYPSDITFDSQGRIWVGTQFEGLLISSDKNSYIRRHAAQRIRSLTRSATKMWVATTDALWMYDLKDLQRPARNVFAEKEFQSAHFEDFALCGSSGDAVWLAFDAGVAKIEYRDDRFWVHPIDFPLHAPVSILEDDDGGIWVGTEYEGIYRFRCNQGQHITPEHLNRKTGLSDDHVKTLFLSRTGKIFAGTDNGLNGIDPRTLACQIYSQISSRVISIEEDETGRLWLGTTRDLTSFDPSTGEIRNYNSRNGLTSRFVTGASYMDAEGILYVGNMDGIDYFDPKSLHVNTFEPRPTINHFLIDNRIIMPGDTIHGRVLLSRPIQDTDTIRLRYYERSFGIEYIALQFNDVPGNRISYMLKGYDKEFLSLNEEAGVAQYSNLHPGVYRFILRARNNDGTWSSQNRELTIIIAQIFWKTWWAWLLYALIVVCMLYVIFKYVHERMRLRQNLTIEQEKLKTERWLTEEKSRFYSNITHEIKTPLSLIVSPVRELSNKQDLDDFTRRRIDIIRNNSEKLLSLINEFLEFRKVESQNRALKVAYRDLTAFLSGEKINFNHIAEEKKIHYVLTNELTDTRFWFDKSIVSKIVNNLLSNAFKFTNNNGYIYLFVSQTETHFTITVADSGCGIADSEQEKIFDRFYRMESTCNIEGVGIGLALVKSLVQLHKGTLRIESSEGIGTSVSVTLPCQESDYTEAEKEQGIKTDDERSVNVVSDEEVGGKPQIVLVEDNQELADYLRETLSDQFDVLVYPSGRSAYERIVKISPDLIVSDVKMEDGDGIELCKQIKRNIAISHIPVILLTALDSDKEVADGYAAGAEDYMTKPFNMETLKLKIGNLISFTRGGNRNKVTVKSKIPAREKAFIDRAIQLINDNLTNPDLSSDYICSALAVSRMQLYRKLTTYTGKSVSEFIRSIRLERALQMLDENRCSISEILYQVGFNNHSYFTRTFKEEFGVTPTEYLNRQKNA